MGSSGFVNIPVFIPHLGCPNDCVFCDQRAISGSAAFDIAAVRREIEEALATISPDKHAEIAFFGGSFTGIERGLMIRLLDMAKRYADGGRVKAIRLSTRPDYIDGEVLEILMRYPVEYIELGIQSMSGAVLEASRRGHDAAVSEAACRAVKAAGFKLVGQMMLGLPLSTPEDEIQTARKLCGLGVDAARIYPTAVLRGTELEKMTERGEYTPLTLNDAVKRAAGVMFIFAGAGVPVIRAGLCGSKGLAGSVYAGAYHEAFGELAEGEIYYILLRERLDRMDRAALAGAEMTVLAPKGATSKVVGHKRINKIKIQREYNVKSLKVIETEGLLDYNIRI